MNDEAIRALSAALAARADDETARRTQRHVRPLRGVRGVPASEVSRILARAADEIRVALPDDAAALSALFGTAWEDGLVAIGLLSVAVAAAPDAAADLALDWVDRTDDVATADALGWLVLGPAAATSGQLGDLLALRKHARPEARRAAVSAALAWTPEPLEGPAAAALRARLGARALRMVDEPATELLFAICSRFARDEAPAVQKAMRRVLRAWAAAEPRTVVRWAATVTGGLPKLLGAVVQEARRAG